ncbi:dihydropteroate synthase [Leptolinea tardivitalis]|uniref:Dihydropteroate synthase n=1 Tax=Leptolinea tardivitalis TaxID=229920 RepID=A0A0P6X124_9CHLR|nr:dihydropteroate synthase [Leptolinea tardivitalis]KPL72940.1 dihydropteroate synthase [Leptolinea tardivitalis]GAP20664.1 dihydropteroate synthase [Leptolinea tardivitalis]
MKPELVYGQRTYIMGIINVTPDSFSGDGLANSNDPVLGALQHAEEFIQAGADILDIGGESTRPGAEPVSAQQEMDRILPVIETLARANLPCLISVDTYRAATAQSALDTGADWINDVWGLRADSDMAAVCAKANVPVILMHNRSKAGKAVLGRYVDVEYTDLLEDIKHDLLECVSHAHKAGIQDKNIILDPGIGFGKTVNQNLELLNRLDEIKSLGYPVLLGPSRKSFIGYTLDLPPEDRLEGTAAAVAVGITRGADIIRVHDVAAMVRVARMTDAIVRGRYTC